MFIFVALAALVSAQNIGGSKDEHGCLKSGGFEWCESLGKCVRRWTIMAEELGDEFEDICPECERDEKFQCDKKCQNGYVMEDGCRTCECFQCPVFKCRACQGGEYVKTHRGCPSCTCANSKKNCNELEISDRWCNNLESCKDVCTCPKGQLLYVANQGSRSSAAACRDAMYCPKSPQQLCRMMCNHKMCDEGQCRMRQGNCCDSKCMDYKDPTDCPGDTKFMTCGTACENQCGKKPAQMCTMQCVKGCQCPNKLFRTIHDECIEQQDCPNVGDCDGSDGYEWDNVLEKCIPVSCDAKGACKDGFNCVEEDRMCVRAPCPQYKCEDGDDIACNDGEAWDDFDQECVAVSCKAEDACGDQKCVPAEINCVRGPCPQFKCIDDCEDDEVFDIDEGECVSKEDELTLDSLKTKCKTIEDEDACIAHGCSKKFKKGKCPAPKKAKKVFCKGIKKDVDHCKAVKCVVKKGKCSGKSKLGQ